MSGLIAPTVGRVVWFFPVEGDPQLGKYPGPLAAIVCHVHSDRVINLTVLDPVGVTHSRCSVGLMQGDWKPNPAMGHAEWMPYQVGQAKKAEAAAVPPHVERMRVELDQLQERTGNLESFVSDPDAVFKGLPYGAQRLLVNQLQAMQAYLEALSTRYLFELSKK